MNELASPDASIAEMLERQRRGEWDRASIIAAHKARIESRDGEIGAYLYVNEKAPVGEDLDLPLAGIPFAIKDVFDVAGWEISRGSKALQGQKPRQNAQVVEALLRAGAHPMGLVKTYELATVGPDATSLYPQPKNPWNLEHVTGGSSSGSAAAVASGTVRFALATDTGGSARSPAAYCGVVGFKPSQNALSLEGVAPLAPSLDHVGLIAGSIADIKAVMRALAPDFSEASPRKGKLIYARNWCFDASAHPSLIGLMDDAVAMLSAQGLQVEIVEFPEYQPIEDAAAMLLYAESFAQYGAMMEANPSAFGEMAKASIALGRDVSEEQLESAKRTLEAFTQFANALTERADAIALPTVMAPAPKFADFAGAKKPWTAMRTMPFNVTGQPAISLPMGFASGMPMGLQLVGQKSGDASLLAIALEFERATDHAVASPYFC